MKKQLVNTLMAVSFLMLGACGLQDAKSVRATKDFYFTHINSPVELDLEDGESLKEAERALSVRFARLDRELTSLTRTMDGVLDPTKQASVAGLLDKFPWLSNAYVLDAEGLILGAIPPQASAVVSFDYLNDKNIEPRELYAHVIMGIDESHFLLARPYIQSGVLVGYLAVSFDPRSLLPFVGDASSVFIRTLDDVLWTGDLYLPETPLADIDWASAINQRSLGKVSEHEQTATWFVRYYGNIALVFGVVE